MTEEIKQALSIISDLRARLDSDKHKLDCIVSQLDKAQEDLATLDRLVRTIRMYRSVCRKVHQ